MKQTTIHIEVEEDILGVNLIPWVYYRHHNRIHNEWHGRAYELITNESNWNLPRHVEPRDNEPDDLDWHKAFGERLLRVCSKRKFKTKQRIVKAFPNGSPHVVSVTVFWNKPTVSTFDKHTHGEWTLRKIEQGKRNKIISRFTGYFECDGDELHSEVPDVEKYEVECDGNSVLYFDGKGESETYYEFRFQAKRQPN